MARTLEIGDRAPLFVARTARSDDYSLASAAGEYVLLCFLDSLDVPALMGAIGDRDIAVVWVVDDAEKGTPAEAVPGIAVVVDADRRIAAGYGHDGGFVLLDPLLRVLAVISPDAPSALAESLGALPVDRAAGSGEPGAPVLLVPRVLEPGFCRRLIAEYERQGGTDSGFMRHDDQGRTVEMVDHSFKRRLDATIADPELRAGFKERIERRLVPEIQRAFQFTATRIERYIVARYDAETGGHFGPHRDNTTKGTAHRRFAVTINLNTGEYEGGELRFPEFDRRTYSAPAGGALVFSCSLLHEATPVTAGRRYCSIPFLYDEPAEEIRRRNLAHVVQASSGTAG